MDIIYNSVNIINNRYKIIEQLGEGGSGITYAAQDLFNKEIIAIKVLSLNQLDDWKKIELFEREAKILQQLEHPNIPNYLDYFQIETDKNCSFYIVQQLAPGKSLERLIERGWQPDSNTIKSIAERILTILIYLQELNPPVIHRDLKPQNIIYQPETGKLFLVDFGAVQDTYYKTITGSTIVGTYGYMAPEQFRGGAVLATDLYSLGCTILFLLTGRSPVELPQKRLKIDFRQSVEIEASFSQWLNKILEPDIGDRFPNAKSALLCLHNHSKINYYQNAQPRKPEYSKIKLTYYQRKLIINLPPLSSTSNKPVSYYIFIAWNIFTTANIVALAASFNIFGLGFVWIALLIIGLFCSREVGAFIYLLQFLFFIVVTIIALVYVPLNIAFYISFTIVLSQFFSNSLLRYKLIRETLCLTKVECSRYRICVKRKGFDWSIDTLFNQKKDWEIDKYTFGHFLSKAEKRWLTVEMNKYLNGDLDFETISGKKYDTNINNNQAFFRQLFSAL